MRLSKNIKEAILKAALVKAGIPAKEQAIRSRYADWAEAVRIRDVPQEMEAEMDRIKSIVEPITEKNHNFRIRDDKEIYIYINVAGVSRQIYFNGCLFRNDSIPLVYKRVAYDRRPLLGDDPLSEQLYQIDHDAKTLKDETEQLKLSLNAVLDSVTTDKQLIKVWPEAVAFIPAAERAAATNLPALPIAELNKLIGLP